MNITTDEDPMEAVNKTLMEITKFLEESKGTYVPYEQRLETYMVPAMFAIIFIVGLLGNGTLMTIFIRNKSMRSVPNTYIMSLATGDILVITITVPFISTIYTFDSWPYGVFICKMSEFLKDMSVGVTVFTLTALSADRYIAIVKPVRRHISGSGKRETMLTAIGIWTISIILATPSAYFSYVRVFGVGDNVTVSVCYPFPPFIEWYPKVSVITRFLIFYVLPLMLISSFYILMSKHLIASSRQAIGETSVVMVNRSSLGQTKQLLERKKVAKIVLIFVVIFALCFLPNHVYMIWFYFNPNWKEDYNEFWHVFKIIGFLLVFVNSCINPIALYCLSAVYRKYFNRYVFHRCAICRCCRRQRPLTNQSSYTKSAKLQVHSMTNASALSYL